MKNNIKAFHVTGVWSANFYYRGFLPAMANGWLVSNDYIDGAPNNGQEFVEKLNRSDIVLFQRPNGATSLELMSLAKQKNKIVVFDDDDTFKVGEGIVPQNGEELEHAIRINENRNKALRMAHGAIATTEFLANELREINSNTIVIPNCIDPDDEGEVLENTTGRPRILILGSVVSNDDWHIAKKAIQQVADRVTFVLIGVPRDGEEGAYEEDMKFWNSLPHIEKFGFTPFGDYYNTIIESAADIAIAPRADNYFNRCKSNLKFLEVSLFGIPFIGQAFPDELGPYQVNPEDRKYLKLATTEDDWCNILEEAIAHIPEYKEMGKKAKEYVLNEYDINKHAHKYVEFYQSLLQ